MSNDSTQRKGVNSPSSPVLLSTKSSKIHLAKLKRAVNKVMAKRQLEKDLQKKLMEGKEASKAEGIQLFIAPDSTKYTVLRYSRAICILVNLILIPSLYALITLRNLSILYSEDLKILTLVILAFFDFIYLIRCILDATLVAYYNAEEILETRPKYIAKRFFS